MAAFRGPLGPVVLTLPSFEDLTIFFEPWLRRPSGKFLGLRLGQCRPFRLDFVAQNRHQVGPFP